MTPELWVAILNFAVKFGIDAAIAIANGLKGGSKTIDDAIAALEMAKTKTPDDYLKEAKGQLPQMPPFVPVPPGSPVPPGAQP